MRVLFINPETERYARQIALPLGLLSIATYLQVHGHTVKILDRVIKAGNIKKEIEEFAPDFVGVSVISMKSFYDAEKVTKAAKTFGAKVVWGGVFASIDPDFIFSNIDIDFISIGEGEETWLELVTTAEQGGCLKEIPGLCWSENGETQYSEGRPFMDLTTLPELDFTLVDVPKYLTSQYGYKHTCHEYMAKGCVGNCSFCFNKKFHNCKYRMRDVDTFLREVKYLMEHYGVDCIYFSDELWCRNREEMKYQCDAFRESGLGFKWGVQTRIGIFDKEDLQYMKDSGCLWVDFGIETGSREMMKKINKGIPYDGIEQTIKDCNDVGIVTLPSFIVGLPDETRENLYDSVQLAKRINATHMTFFFFMPSPGMKLFNELVESGRYDPPKTFRDYQRAKFFTAPSPNFSQIPSLEIKVIRDFFLWRAFSKQSFGGEARKYELAKKNIIDVLKQFQGHGIRFALHHFFFSAYEFLSIFFYANFFPGVLKRYGIDKKNDFRN